MTNSQTAKDSLLGTPLLLEVADAAAILGMGREKVYGLIRDGRIRGLRFGRLWKVPRSELEAFVERELEAQHGAYTSDEMGRGGSA